MKKKKEKKKYYKKKANLISFLYHGLGPLVHKKCVTYVTQITSEKTCIHAKVYYPQNMSCF